MMGPTNPRTNLLIILAKYPSPGNVKTRLAAEIGESAATNISRALLLDLVGVHSSQPYRTVIQAARNDVIYIDEFRELCPNLPIRIGTGDELRGPNSEIWRAFRYYSRSYNAIVLICADTPFISMSLIEESFEALECHDVVVGPDTGTGYYLIGMKEPHDLFTSLPTTRGPYRERTLKMIENLGLTVKLLPSLTDIDTLADISAIDWTGSECLAWKQTMIALMEGGYVETEGKMSRKASTIGPDQRSNL